MVPFRKKYQLEPGVLLNHQETGTGHQPVTQQPVAQQPTTHSSPRVIKWTHILQCKKSAPIMLYINILKDLIES